MQTIFYLEGRSNQFLYHFFIYVMGGLHDIENKIYNKRGEKNSSVPIVNDKIVNTPTTICNAPYKIYIGNTILSYQREAFNIIQDKFLLINSLPQDNYELISMYGCINTNSGRTSAIHYMRQLFIDKFSYPIQNKKYTYITRKGPVDNHNGVMKRQVINELELLTMLNKYNFNILALETLTDENKIK